MTATDDKFTTVLYYKAGTSDKQYRISIVPTGAGFSVVAVWGRRNAPYQIKQIKTAVPVSLDEAKKLYDRLLQAKVAKGYLPWWAND